jgi:hypothetical protein
LINHHHHHQLFYFFFFCISNKKEEEEKEKARKDQEINVDVRRQISSDINDLPYLSLYCGNAFNR